MPDEQLNEQPSKRFTGQVAIVTGSSADPSIGRACAVRLAREGASVIINGRDSVALAATERDLRDKGLAVHAVAGSMEDESTPGALVDAASARFGRIDLLVNTIGGTRFQGSFESMGRADLLDTVALNTWPTLALIQAAMLRGLADGGGAVVNISSGSPKKTTPSMVAYAAAKAALNALTRTVAADLGPRGVRVNAVSPGLTRTTATRPQWERDGGAAAGANIVLGRLTEADDIAAATAFLLSADARQITGVVLDVDGGNHLASGGWTPITPPRAP
ncbi:MAG TPA: SDR family oxidoreductase [Acidimicrobiales bacterium]|nr:SDR family oxidoreductase [Acidimicrobiales bacterium]